jgi:hypothetical protein
MPSSCRSRPARRARTGLGARLMAMAIALAALLVIYNGERWVLQESWVAANEYTAAACVAEDVYGDDTPAGACAVGLNEPAKGLAR